MGRDLAERFPEARFAFEEADEVLRTKLSRLAFEGPESELVETRNAQPAILVHSIAVYRVLESALPEVRFAAGHSLGELSAYVASGALAFADGVRTVRLRGELMYQGGQERPGTMAAILGLDDDVVERVCRESEEEGGECVPANFNSPAQVVISGDVAAVERAMDGAKAAGARRAVRLNVSGAFHSPLMAVAESGLAAHLETVTLQRPRFGIVSNVSAEPVTEPDDARRLLIQQLTSPVRWAESMRRMREAGVERFLEIGPGSVLSGLMRRIDRGVQTRSLGTADEIDAFLEGE